ncbi:SprT-like domain-containing protein [Halocatena halophila]|uniref:SprT-like domain-containing protein n=1 Tax=Halocatena halophila TaxID=2814576 RepID=UPI002ED1F843
MHNDKQAEYNRMVQAINNEKDNEKETVSNPYELESKSPSQLLSMADDYSEEIVETHDLPISTDDFTIDISKRMTKSRGLCRKQNDEVQIRLSWPDYENNGWEQTQETIRHELIHAHQYINHGEADHGPTFKEWMDELDTSVYADDPASKGKYTIRCPNCYNENYRHRECKVVRQPENYKCTVCGHIGLTVDINE